MKDQRVERCPGSDREVRPRRGQEAAPCPSCEEVVVVLQPGDLRGRWRTLAEHERVVGGPRERATPFADASWFRDVE